MRRHKSDAGFTATAYPGYSELSEIATGTFATVYEATELATGRRVALKVLRLEDRSPHMAEVFDKELGALALLSDHPNVTTLYRTFISPEGRPVLVLELCRGSLAQRVNRGGALPPVEVARVGVKIAGALETAHRSGLLHRDVKPQNLLVSQFGEPMLADFGVAALQATAQSTEGVFGFTTLHAPPEVLEGQPLSPATDVYGLASSLYQLALGHGPFAAFEGEAPASVILRILRDPAPRPPITAVPVALADLMEAALAKDPANRPQSADAFAEALRAVEAEAGWAQTPYVVWGPAAVDGAAPAPAAPGQAPLMVALPWPTHRAALRPRFPTEPWRPAGTTTLPPLPSGPDRDGQPAPPGTRAVVAPPATSRNVVSPRALPPMQVGGTTAPRLARAESFPAGSSYPMPGLSAGSGEYYGVAVRPRPAPAAGFRARALAWGKDHVIALSVVATALLLAALVGLVLVLVP